MKRFSTMLLPLFVLVLAPLAGCSGSSSSSGNSKADGGPIPGLKADSGPVVPGLKKDGAVCSGAAQQNSGNECAGSVCIALIANDQNRAGTCTTSCTTSCADDELCVSGFPDGGSYCLRTCETDANCLDGFACVDDSGDQFCWVTTGGGGGTPPDAGGTPPGGHVDCTGCPLLDDVAGYCGTVPGSTQVCDCPYGSPSASCTATPGAANTWCCP